MLSEIENLVILSVKEKGSELADSKILPNAVHSYWIYRIEKNIKAAYKIDASGLIRKTAKTLYNTEIVSKLDETERIWGDELRNYLSGINLRSWTSAAFPRARLEYVTSEVAPTINSA